MVRIKKVGKYEIEELEKPFPLDDEKAVENWLQDKAREEEYEKTFAALVEECRSILRKGKENKLVAYWRVGDTLRSFIASIPEEQRTETYNRTKNAIYTRISERLGDIEGTSEWYIDMMVRFREYEPDPAKIDRTITWSTYWELMAVEKGLYPRYKKRAAEGNFGKREVRWFLKVRSVCQLFTSSPDVLLTLEEIRAKIESNVAGQTLVLAATLKALVDLGALRLEGNAFVCTPVGNDIMVELLQEIEAAENGGTVMRALEASGLDIP